MPLLNDPTHKDMIASLKNRVPAILKLNTPQKPRAIILCTAHWSEYYPSISSASKHKLYYDYGGFPAETYKLKYDAPGSPEVAQELAAALREEGLRPMLDEERGWDHGLFVPMTLIRPQADIPIVQLSVLSSEDPAQHFAMGRALSKLRDTNVAIIGSGFATFHNMRGMARGGMSAPDFLARNKEWSDAVTSAAEETDLLKRETMFRDWRKWPYAYEAHPQRGAEHFLPLIVVAGAVGNERARSYGDDYKGCEMLSYYWE